MVPLRSGSQPTRRALLRTGLAATAFGALGGLAAVAASPASPSTSSSPVYAAALKTTGGMKAVFQSPAIDARLVSGQEVNHLLLIQLKNWLNSFELSYKLDPTDLHTIVATYASANILTYGDALWQKNRLGEKYEIIDPVSGKAATRNLFWPSRFASFAPPDPAPAGSIYLDTGIEALQQRGAIFLTCTNSLLGHAAAAVADGRAPNGMDADAVAADFKANLIPNAVLVPAVVGEVSRAQQAGYTLVFIPKFAL
jgi:hypothetical protein